MQRARPSEAQTLTLNVHVEALEGEMKPNECEEVLKKQSRWMDALVCAQREGVSDYSWRVTAARRRWRAARRRAEVE